MGMSAEPVQGKRRGSTPEINVTPLVDVVLVLLIIFMVVTPQLEAGENVDLPVVVNPDPKARSRLDPVTVTYTLSGRFLLEKEPLTEVELLARLKNIHAETPERRLLLKGDKNLKFGQMRALFQACKAIGFQGVSLVVGDRDKGKGA
jgi:biopolymer transport protein ExbD/biopolymer transport protein TolR